MCCPADPDELPEGQMFLACRKARGRGYGRRMAGRSGQVRSSCKMAGGIRALISRSAPRSTFQFKHGLRPSACGLGVGCSICSCCLASLGLARLPLKLPSCACKMPGNTVQRKVNECSPQQKPDFKKESSCLTNADWLRAAGPLEEDHR